MAAYQAGQPVDGLLLLAGAVGGVHHGGVQHPAGAVDDRHLAAVGIAGVQAHGDVALYRGLHQQGLQVQAEVGDGPLAGGVSQVGPGLPLQGGVDQPVIGVLTGGLDKLHSPGPGSHHRPAQSHQTQLPVQQHGDGEDALLFAPVDGQDLVPGQLGDGLVKVVIQPVNGVLLRGGQTPQMSLPAQQLPQGLADGGIVRQQLRYDVVGPLEGVGQSLHPLLWVHIVPGGLLRSRAVPALVQQQKGQGLQALLPGHRGPGAALLLIGAVQVLHLRQGGGAVDGGGQLVGELPLAVDGVFHLLAALVQVPQIAQPVLQGPQGGVVHAAVQLLAVAGDEGDGIALVQQVDDVLHMGQGLVQLPGQNFGNGLHA